MKCLICGENTAEDKVCRMCKLAEEAPCHTCTKRAEGCHVYCREYIEFSKARERARAIKLKKNDEESYFIKRTKQKQWIMIKKGDLGR